MLSCSTRPRTYSLSYHHKIVWIASIILCATLSDEKPAFFSLPATVRRALLEAPENVATLIRVITSRLFNLVSDHTFPSPQSTNTVASVANFATTFVKTGGTTERNTTKEVLNCIRVLTRVLPVLFEIDSELSIFEREVLWKREAVAPGQELEEQVEQTPQFVIEDEDEDGPSGASASSSVDQLPPRERETKKSPALAERLFSCLVDLLFCCGFTLPAKVQVDHYKINYIIW
jgi:hypothetical protein